MPFIKNTKNNGYYNKFISYKYIEINIFNTNHTQRIDL